MNTLAERLQIALNNKDGATKADLARACGIKPPSVNDWFSGKTKSLRDVSLVRAANFLGVTKEWLAEGKGPKRIDSPGLEYAGKANPSALLPVAGIAQLGENGWYDEITADGSEGYVEHYTGDDNAYVLRVRGDSMHPAIRNGWYVVVEPSMSLAGGLYVAVALNDGRKLVKEYLYETTDEYALQSVNGGERLNIERSSVMTIHAISAVVAPSKHTHH